jgi:hypothetical protein
VPASHAVLSHALCSLWGVHAVVRQCVGSESDAACRKLQSWSFVRLNETQVVDIVALLKV